jgi:hypothetical protein
MTSPLCTDAHNPRYVKYKIWATETPSELHPPPEQTFIAAHRAAHMRRPMLPLLLLDRIEVGELAVKLIIIVALPFFLFLEMRSDIKVPFKPSLELGG